MSDYKIGDLVGIKHDFIVYGKVGSKQPNILIYLGPAAAAKNSSVMCYDITKQEFYEHVFLNEIELYE